MELSILVLNIFMLGTVIGIFGITFFLISLKKLGGMFKKSLIWIFAASFIWIIYSAVIIGFAIYNTAIQKVVLITLSLGYTLTTVIYLIGTKKLLDMLSFPIKQVKK